MNPAIHQFHTPWAGVERLEDEVGKTGLCAVRVLGTSMRPTLRDGDVVLLERVAPQSLRFGDVLAFRTSGCHGSKLIVHRLVRRHRLGGRTVFVLKGDGCSALGHFGADPGDRLVGRVRAAWRGPSPVDGVVGLGALSRALLSLLKLPWQRWRGH